MGGTLRKAIGLPTKVAACSSVQALDLKEFAQKGECDVHLEATV